MSAAQPDNGNFDLNFRRNPPQADEILKEIGLSEVEVAVEAIHATLARRESSGYKPEYSTFISPVKQTQTFEQAQQIEPSARSGLYSAWITVMPPSGPQVPGPNPS